ncbi:hypothetical protein OG203_07850 [Nocardia sp. NBC_01499]|uniref:hypothetical protein n=1 Tax=Nocardia sp. NBC_01499 TaxID=2903597 RepID=UPI00386DF5A2
MTSEHDECRVTIDGVAPALVTLFRRAVQIASEHGRNWVGVEDLHAALANSDEHAPIWWPRVGKPRHTRDTQGGITPDDLEGEVIPLSYKEFRDLVTAWVPGPTPSVGPAQPATVTYEISGPHAEEFRKVLERS